MHHHFDQQERPILLYATGQNCSVHGIDPRRSVCRFMAVNQAVSLPSRWADITEIAVERARPTLTLFLRISLVRLNLGGALLPLKSCKSF
ncbi:hypothetical protein [Mesorhizobium sp. J18]|uniref:hypothetical protein n=1 Tax=Mesorhizobium sp. J18 TaxID=935263 RepID=UPI0011A2CFBD|nr:hypothetical protein [Mesorhizobium sp. J18]